MSGLISKARYIPKVRRLTGPLQYLKTCCGWTLRGTHDTTSEQHHQAVNRYMRLYYRKSLTWQLRHYLGTNQEELPSALVELAVTRRRLQEAAKLVGNWRVNEQVDDPS
jgi:hypothetical protein